MLTERGPIMIEVGARLHGGMAPQTFLLIVISRIC